MIQIRIHHFFDILRDYGCNRELTPHEYGHSYHLIGQSIYNNEILEMKLIIGNDDICINCRKLSQEKCIDTISHRVDFISKDDFNNHIDIKIMEAMNLIENQIISFKELLTLSPLYIESIESIYEGNDTQHTLIRKNNVGLGLKRKQDEIKNLNSK